MLLTKTTATPNNEVALSYHKVRGLYFLTVVLATTMVNDISQCNGRSKDTCPLKELPRRNKDTQIKRAYSPNLFSYKSVYCIVVAAQVGGGAA